MKNLFVTTEETYTKRIEGDVWEEKGKVWTIKNGIKRTVTKMDEARKQLLTPMACPKCGKAVKHPIDEKMYTIHKTCFDCVVEMEHKIRVEGRWEEYEKQKMSANANGFLKDLTQWFEEEIKDSVTHKHVTEDGIVEKWKDVDEKVLEDIKDNVIDSITKTVETLNSK